MRSVKALQGKIGAYFQFFFYRLCYFQAIFVEFAFFCLKISNAHTNECPTNCYIFNMALNARKDLVVHQVQLRSEKIIG